MNITDVFVLLLASWRLSNLLVNEEGPGEMFVRIRKKMGVSYNVFSELETDSWTGRLFSCIWCMSIWASFVLVVMYQWWLLRLVFVIPLAISAGVVILNDLRHPD